MMVEYIDESLEEMEGVGSSEYVDVSGSDVTAGVDTFAYMLELTSAVDVGVDSFVIVEGTEE
jgi:hypothetical protein